MLQLDRNVALLISNLKYNSSYHNKIKIDNKKIIFSIELL